MMFFAKSMIFFVNRGLPNTICIFSKQTTSSLSQEEFLVHIIHIFDSQYLGVVIVKAPFFSIFFVKVILLLSISFQTLPAVAQAIL